MNILANNNGNVVDGTFVRNGITNAGNLSITGNGYQSMQVNNNALNGIGGNVLTNQMGSLSINGMNIEVNENKGRGIYLYETTANISAANGTNTLNVSGNGYEGLLLSKSQMNITNMNIIANGNGFTSDNAGQLSGISTNDRLTITGTGSQSLQANSNQGSGIYLGNFTTILGNADFSLSNMNVQILSNGVHGLHLNNGTAKLTGNGTNVMMIQENSKDGLHIDSGTMTLSDIDVDTSKNDQRGIGMGNGNNPVKLEISSTSGLNTLSVNENGYEGISVSDNAATLTLKNMNIEVNKNGFKAREAGDSASGFSVWGTVDIQGTGNNYIQVNGNERAGLAIAKRDTDVITPKVTISNMNMSANENAQQGIDVSADDGPGGTSFEISSTNNNSLILNNNGLEGLRVTKGGDATISDMNIGISGNGAQGIAVVDSKVSISSSRRNNQLQLSNNATANILIQNVGDTYAKDATLTLDGMAVYSSGSTFASVQNSTIAYTAKLAMSNSQLILGSNNQVFDLNKGNVELSNVQQSGTQPVSLVTNTGTSTFKATIYSSVIGKITDNGQLTSTLSDNSSWKMLDSSNMHQLHISDSSVDMRSLTGGYNTLTVGNAYLADNATLYMNTNMDETQLTDQLVLLDGSHIVGKTNLNITNTAPATSYGTFIKGDGIKVVDAQGSTFTGADSFDLVGKKIDTGLYIQELYYQNLDTSDESWYIRTATEDDGGGNKGSDGSHSNGNKPKPTDLTKTVANMPAVALSVVKTINSELRNRLGELRSNNPKAHNGLWARGYMKSLEVDEKIKNEMDIYGFEAGYDHLISKDSQTRTYLGIMAGYAQVDKIKVDQDNGYKGKGEGSVPSVGAYLTWINKNGWYTDTVIRGFLTKLDITNYSAQGLPITYDADRMAVAGSFEFGRRTALYQKGRNGFIVEPKAQVVYTYMPSKDHKTSLGQKIKYDTTQSLVTRAALMAAYRRTFANGMALEPYIQVGIAYEWLGKTDVNFIGSDFTSDVSGATFEGVLGINARLSRGWHLYGDFTLEKGSVYDSYGGHLGVRYNF